MTDTKDVQIERTFDAPIDVIWAMWTEAEHFANWYGPMGAKIPRADMDVRVGGRRHIAMEIETPDGPMLMFFVGEYREVDPKTRLVYTPTRGESAMPKVSMTGKFTCQDGKNDEMDKAVAAQTDALMGDTNVEIYAYNRGEGNQYTFYALFPSEEAMQNHGQGEEMQEAMETFKALLDGPPDVFMTTPVAAKGFSI